MLTEEIDLSKFQKNCNLVFNSKIKKVRKLIRKETDVEMSFLMSNSDELCIFYEKTNKFLDQIKSYSSGNFQTQFGCSKSIPIQIYMTILYYHMDLNLICELLNIMKVREQSINNVNYCERVVLEIETLKKEIECYLQKYRLNLFLSGESVDFNTYDGYQTKKTGMIEFICNKKKIMGIEINKEKPKDMFLDLIREENEMYKEYEDKNCTLFVDFVNKFNLLKKYWIDLKFSLKGFHSNETKLLSVLENARSIMLNICKFEKLVSYLKVDNASVVNSEKLKFYLGYCGFFHDIKIFVENATEGYYIISNMDNFLKFVRCFYEMYIDVITDEHFLIYFPLVKRSRKV